MGLGDAAGSLADIVSRPVTLLKKIWSKPLVRLCTALFAGICIVVPVLTVFFVKINEHSKKKAELPAAPRAAAASEIFLPEEPDFLPQVLLQRESSTVWTLEDGKKYWNAPQEDGGIIWLDTIEKTIDTLLEKVR
jgi:hypothetical protein